MDSQEFHSAPYYQQEKAKTFFWRVEMIWAKLIKEADYQLDQQQKRGADIIVPVEEQEGSEISPQESTTIAVDAGISVKPHLSLANEVLNGINWVVVAVFYLEIVLKWMVDFCQFWRNTWNIFDFLLTFLSVLPEIIVQQH
ncbi:hypothetical protein AOLI_G00158430 [Acnodon oligacanthus]